MPNKERNHLKAETEWRYEFFIIIYACVPLLDNKPTLNITNITSKTTNTIINKKKKKKKQKWLLFPQNKPIVNKIHFDRQRNAKTNEKQWLLLPKLAYWKEGVKTSKCLSFKLLLYMEEETSWSDKKKQASELLQTYRLSYQFWVSSLAAILARIVLSVAQPQQHQQHIDNTI